ncbi:hypothetical protein WR25_22281 [Diploscapter pachys]|uniref:Major facilitator superfamily (MFS) profile domain-containing protein n=1 Tax=Diploscapter pachys TaxID=2018661 RepID=A0A2A2L5B6_9BILA|nr:hypothetical protein WR25_22281 [Diploscapter pachys]
MSHTHASPSLFSKNGLRLFALCWVFTIICNFPSGFSHTSINTAVNELYEYINGSYIERGNGSINASLSEGDLTLYKSTINSAWYIAQILGALSSPYLCDNYGRKVAFIISVIMMNASAALQSLATLTIYPEIYFAGRIVTAIFSPLSDSALILYLQEVSPPSLRGTMSSLFMTGYNLMGLIGMVAGDRRILGHNLTLLLFFPVFFGIPAVIYMCFIHETPKFLMLARNDREGALRSLRFYQGKLPTHECHLDEMSGDGTETKKDEPHWKEALIDIIHKTHLRRAFSISMAALVLTLPFYPLQQNSTLIYLSMGISLSTAQTASSFTMVLLTIVSLFATTIIDRFSSRSILLLFGTLSWFSLLAFVAFEELGYPMQALYATFAFLFCYGIGISPVVWSLPPEMSPIHYRSLMLAICYSTHSLLVFAGSFLTPPLFKKLGGFSFFFLFAIPSAFALVWLYARLPETQGREIDDIINELKGHRSRSDIKSCVDEGGSKQTSKMALAANEETPMSP